MKNARDLRLCAISLAAGLFATASRADIEYTVLPIAPVTAGYPATMVSDLNDRQMVSGSTRNYGSHGTVSQNGWIFKQGSGAAYSPLNWINGINRNGDVAGARIFNSDPSAELRSPAVVINGVQRDIGAEQGSAFDLNNDGIVVGTGAGLGSLWTWNAVTGAVNTILAGQGVASDARINRKGQVFGSVGVPYFYDPAAGLTQLPTSMRFPGGINDRGDMVGNSSENLNGSSGTLITHDGVTISFLAVLGGRGSFLGGIDDNGVVAGAAKPTASDPGGGFVYDQSRGVRMLDLLIPQGGGGQVHVMEVLSVADDGSILAKLESSNPFIGMYYGVLAPVPAPGAIVLFGLTLVGRRGKR